jgi:hypothetical protein
MPPVKEWFAQSNADMLSSSLYSPKVRSNLPNPLKESDEEKGFAKEENRKSTQGSAGAVLKISTASTIAFSDPLPARNYSNAASGPPYYRISGRRQSGASGRNDQCCTSMI